MTQSDHVLYGSFEHDYVTMTRGDGVYVFDEAATATSTLSAASASST